MGAQPWRADERLAVVCEDGRVKYVATMERFQSGDFPMVCVRSGLPATKMVPVRARRTTVWPWALLPISVLWFALTKWAADSDHPWGKLPFAEGHVSGITASYEKSIGVIIKGVHPDFVDATRRSQGKRSLERIDVRDRPESIDPLLDSTAADEGSRVGAPDD